MPLHDDSLTFNASALSVVSGWLGGDNSAATASSSSTHHQQDTKSDAATGRYKRAGLGASTAKKKMEDAKEGNKSMGTLQKLLMGNNKKKSKRQREEEEKEAAAARAAGEEDDDDEEGELVDSKVRALAASTPRVVPTAQALVPEPAKKKRRQKKKKTGGNNNTTAEGGEAQASTTAVTTSAPATAAPTVTDAVTYKKHEGEGVAGDVGAEAGQHKSGRKRLRKKTRSKQKNIRRDNRSMEQRPVHLRQGHETFTGRELTEETKKRLEGKSLSK